MWRLHRKFRLFYCEYFTLWSVIFPNTYTFGWKKMQQKCVQNSRKQLLRMWTKQMFLLQATMLFSNNRFPLDGPVFSRKVWIFFQSLYLFIIVQQQQMKEPLYNCIFSILSVCMRQLGWHCTPVCSIVMSFCLQPFSVPSRHRLS